MTGSVNRYKKAWAQRILPLCLCGFVVFASMPALAQSNDINNRLKRIENDVETLNRAVYKGEKPPASAGSSGNSEADRLLQNRINQIEKDLRDITGKVEEANFATQQLQQKLDAMEARMNAMPPPSASGPAPMGASNMDPMASTPPDAPAPLGPTDTNVIPPTAPDGSPAVMTDPNAHPLGGAVLGQEDNVTGNETGLGAANDAAGLYEQGFAQIKAQDYTAAETSFAKFMREYPTHALAPNALYWLGETYYVRKDYDKAARTFAEAYQKYPNGPKGADNLLKLGLSLAAKGQKDNACIALGQLKKEYPKGPDPVLKKGESEMAALGCK